MIVVLCERGGKMRQLRNLRVIQPMHRNSTAFAEFAKALTEGWIEQ